MATDSGWLARMLLALALSFLPLLPDGTARQAAPIQESAWLGYLHDAARTSSSEATIGSNVTHRWTQQVDGLIASEPVVADGRVYIGSWDGHLYAFSAINGSRLWTTFLGTYIFKNYDACGSLKKQPSGITASPTLVTATNTLYIAAADNVISPTNPISDTGPFLYAINAANGQIRWRQPLSDNNDNYAWSSPLIANGRAFVGVASGSDCPLTQGQLVAVDLEGAHTIRRVAMAPDALALSPDRIPNPRPGNVGSAEYFTATLRFEYLSATATRFELRLRNLRPQHRYQSEIRYQPVRTQTCATALVHETLGEVTADISGTATLTGTVLLDTRTLTDGQHFLHVSGVNVPDAVPCSTVAAGTGGGIWSSPTWDAATQTVFVTTGTPTPPCVPQDSCTGSASIVGPHTAAVVAVDAKTLTIKGWWQVPFTSQDVDADFGASATLCGRVLGVANKNGLFYAFNADTPYLWQQTGPLWSHVLAQGGGGPEVADGSISSAACRDGVFYVASGRPPTGATICANYTGQIWALEAATGHLRQGWTNPHCTGLVIGPVTLASELIVYGTDCRALARCLPETETMNPGRRIELLDMATGLPRFVGTAVTLQQSCASCPPLGDVLSGVAVVDGLLVFGDNPVCSKPCYVPSSATVRALNAVPMSNTLPIYLPLVKQ